MKKILITGIGGPTPRSIARTLKNNHSDYKIVGVDANPKALGFFIPGLVDSYYVVPRMNHPDYWSSIKKIIINEDIDIAFVQPELEVIGWGKYLKDNGSYPCPVFIPPVEIAMAMMDKSIMANLLNGTAFIPKTLKVSHDNPKFQEVISEIGFPCWIRATIGSGGLGSLKVLDLASYKSWLFINHGIEEFTISEFLPGRHLATQMLYYKGEYIKGASLECVEYVMASIAPSKVTGNTSFGRFLNENRILEFCNNCVSFICHELELEAHGVLSFDLKEDTSGNLKVTEINIRHMAYTGVMAQVGFNLIEDTLILLTDGNANKLTRQPYYRYRMPFVFLRDVDTEPVILESEEFFPM